MWYVSCSSPAVCLPPFISFGKKAEQREQRCLASPPAQLHLCFPLRALIAPTPLRRTQLPKFSSNVKKSGISSNCTCVVFPNDFGYISFLTQTYAFLFENFPSLRQQRKCCKPIVKVSSCRAARRAAGNERASGALLPARCVAGSSKAFKNNLLGNVAALRSSLLF